MKLLFFLLFAAAASAQNPQPTIVNARFETRAFSGNLDSQLRSVSAAWFGYAVKAVGGEPRNCCWNGSGVCESRLEDGPATVAPDSRPQGPVQLEAPAEVAILFRVENNNVEKVRVSSLSCALDAGGLAFVWIASVPVQASLAYLQTLLAAKPLDRVDNLVFAISQHASPQADAILEQLTRPAQTEKIRDKAIFWLGASRGAAGAGILKTLLTGDPSEHIRDKAIFALSISKQPEALESLLQAAHNDSSPHVRSQALFWLAQKAGKRAVSAIQNAIDNDPDTEVKKRAVFALSRLPQDEGVPKLIEVARNQKNPEVRKQAFFWLGRSNDARALAFFEQILTK